MPTIMSEPQASGTQHARHVWIITGPAGCGKTTVAKYLAEKLALPYVEGDEYHPKSNVEKMAAGTPLNDGDRWDWLTHLRQHSLERLHEGAVGVVLTCSALKKKYRDVFRVAPYNDHNVMVHFVYLHASEELLLQRVKAREGHFMKDAMVHSQITSLEEPDIRDEPDCLVVDVSGALADVQNTSLAAVKGLLKKIVSNNTLPRG